jgi:beta-xylosidase
LDSNYFRKTTGTDFSNRRLLMSGNRRSADAPPWTPPAGGSPLAAGAVVDSNGGSRGGTVTDDLPGAPAPWQDTSLPATERVADLLGRMTMEEKVAQLGSAWMGIDGAGEVAPHQHEFAVEEQEWSDLIADGIGQLTRPFGTAPVDPASGARVLARMQGEIMAANRFGIPAVAHDECLAGFTAWQATVYPVPLAWGASFHPELVERMAQQIGTGMRALGVHQGLAPVLDVTRDLRWGRTEETIGEDPYLVGTVATAYVKGLQSAGIIATLKHFVGYSASRAGRNHAPVEAGRRELNDVLLPPFEMAVREGRVGSVMNSYAEIDGMPPAANPELLTSLLRVEWGFTGTVVADYFSVAFLEQLHQVAGSPAEAAGLALAAGLDVELPNTRCFGEPLLDAVRTGAVPIALIDRAASRVLLQKCELGLLDPAWTPVPPALAGAADSDPVIALDPPESRAVARQLADESVVLLANSGVLPLAADARVALVGPLADDVTGMLGCYSFPSHVGRHHPEIPIGVDIPTVARALREELPRATVTHALGCTVDGPERDGFAAAEAAARDADVCVVVVGDRAGLFGKGTSGEGCDVGDLYLPGLQRELVEAMLATGTPVVLVALSGRPYALGAYADRLAAAVQAFFPGEEGGPAVAGVLSGRVCPSGRLPVGIPRDPGGQPAPYLSPPLGQRNDVSTVDPTPLYPFGHGLSYTAFEWTEASADVTEFATDGSVTVSVTVRNTGERAGAEVVQLYLHDPVAQVTRPVIRLIGYARVELEPGQQRRVSLDVHADLTSFTGRLGQRIVEPGDLELRLGASSADIRHTVPVRLVGPEREVDHGRRLLCDVRIDG